MSAKIDQHELVTTFLCAGGGRRVEEALPVDYAGKRADVVFTTDNVIAEVKSLTSDRRRDPQVATKLGSVMERNVHRGAPVIFGRATVRAHDLPTPVAEQALRVVGSRVRKEVSAAKEQLAATKAALAMPDAYGLLVVVTPPEQIGIQTIAWAIGDAVKHSENPNGIDGALVIETPLGMSSGSSTRKDSFLGLFSISGRPLSSSFIERIGEAWGAVTSQVSRIADVEDFVRFGASE
jgi:hypothetical protein